MSSIIFNNKTIYYCALALGFVAFGFLAKRVVSWINQYRGITEKIHSKGNEILPQYAKVFIEDSLISQECKCLFKILFVELINPHNIKQIQPLGNLVDKIAQRLLKFNQESQNLPLACRGTAHSNSSKDPWQTIKITSPTIKTIGAKSDLLIELNNSLFKHYGIQSNGGSDWQDWVNQGDKVKGQKKYDPICFEEKGTTFYPQLQISLIDIKRIIGVIPTVDAYFQALRDAYNQKQLPRQ